MLHTRSYLHGSNSIIIGRLIVAVDVLGLDSSVMFHLVLVRHG